MTRGVGSLGIGAHDVDVSGAAVCGGVRGVHRCTATPPAGRATDQPLPDDVEPRAGRGQLTAWPFPRPRLEGCR